MDPIDIAATPQGSTLEGAASALEERLFGKDDVDEPNGSEEDEIVDGAEELPDDNDPDSDDKEGSDLDDIAEDEELTLADYLGIDDDRVIVKEDGTVTINAKIDGELKEVDMKELVSSYQMQGHVNNKSMALETERKNLGAERTKISQELEGRVSELQNISAILESQLTADYDSIDWDNLRVADPAEWTALRSQFSERAQQIQQAQLTMQKDAQLATQKAAQEQGVLRAQHLKAERTKLVELNPTWNDPVVMGKELTSMKSFLADNYGFQAEELKDIMDHRLIRVIQDAQGKHSLKSVEEEAAKKLQKKVPKFQKPGASKASSKNLEKARSVKAKRTAVKKTGHVKDVAALIESRM